MGVLSPDPAIQGLEDAVIADKLIPVVAFVDLETSLEERESNPLQFMSNYTTLI